MLTAQIILALWIVMSFCGQCRDLYRDRDNEEIITETVTTIIVGVLLVVVCYKAGAFSQLL